MVSEGSYFFPMSFTFRARLRKKLKKWYSSTSLTTSAQFYKLHLGYLLICFTYFASTGDILIIFFINYTHI
ncbi:hypothetical protein CUU66_03555 [Peribacillus deserti]|uniref:Uncharacterized protein n=1 Tax=Peribacillus deserti TaxID=673318 RepID=A0A2N5MA74_9BACI|nr:hypothetical protein CUU66_03555 [Peribacillus deserti]